MPPFRYTPNQNRYVGSIADLMGRGNEAEAQALIASANAQAQAAQASGQAWGGAVQGIGNTIAAIPGQMQAQQDRDRVMEERERDDQTRAMRADIFNTAPGHTIGPTIADGRLLNPPPPGPMDGMPGFGKATLNPPGMPGFGTASIVGGPGAASEALNPAAGDVQGGAVAEGLELPNRYRTTDANGSDIFDLEQIIAAFASAGLDAPDMSPYLAINQEISGRFDQSLANARGVARTLLEGPAGAWEQGLRTSLGVYEANGLLPAPMLASMRSQLEDIASLPPEEKEARLGQLLHQLTGETIETQIFKPGDIAGRQIPGTNRYDTEEVGGPDQNLTGEEQALNAYANSLGLDSRLNLSHAQRSEYTREQRDILNPGSIISIADPSTGQEAYWTRSASGETTPLLLPDGTQAKPRGIEVNKDWFSLNGEDVYLTGQEASDLNAGRPSTADMRNKQNGRKLVGPSITAVKALSERVITLNGTEQRLKAIKEGTLAALGEEPEFKTYQAARNSLAGNLAVAQQGARPSDADIEKVWLPLVPDAYSDTAESAEMKWDLIYLMSNISREDPKIGDTINAMLNRGVSPEAVRQFILGSQELGDGTSEGLSWAEIERREREDAKYRADAAQMTGQPNPD